MTVEQFVKDFNKQKAVNLLAFSEKVSFAMNINELLNKLRLKVVKNVNLKQFEVKASALIGNW